MSCKNYIILYPRVYNRRGTEDRHSIFGITDEGREISVKLRAPKDGCLGITVNDLAQSGIDAKTPCIAASDNGPGASQKGALLFTDLSFEDGDTYVARSVHVIRSGVEPILPIKGLGRLKIDKDTRAVLSARARLSDPEISEEEKARLDGIVHDPSHYQYSAIVYHPEKSMQSVDSHNWVNQIACFAQDQSVNSLLVRVFDSECGVRKLEELSVYNDPVVSLSEQWTERLLALEEQLEVGPDSIVSAIAFDEYQCSKDAARFYAQAYPYLKDLYYKDEMPALTEVMLSLSESPTSDDLLLKMLFPLTKRVGMLRNLDSDGGFSFGVKLEEDLGIAFKQGVNQILVPAIHKWAPQCITALEVIEPADEATDQILNVAIDNSAETEIHQSQHKEPYLDLELDEDPFGDLKNVSVEVNDVVIETTPIEVLTVDSFGLAEDLAETLESPSKKDAPVEMPTKGLAAFIAKRIG